MSTPECYGPDCTYTEAGPPGRYIQTAGYMAQAEINEIIATNSLAQLLSDSGSNTVILVYRET